MVEYWNMKFKWFTDQVHGFSLNANYNVYLNYNKYADTFYVDMNFETDGEFWVYIKDNINPPDRQKWLDALHQLLERIVYEW